MGRGGGGGSRGGGSGGGRSGGGRSSFRSSSRGGRSSGGSLGGSYNSGGYRSRSRMPGRAARSAVRVVLLCLLYVLITFIVPLFYSSVTPSTIKREPLKTDSITVGGYYTDTNGWILSENKLIKGMRTFRDKTGVQPYVYITDKVPGYDKLEDANLEGYANELYDSLFKDEAHCLLLWAEDSTGYQSYVVTGASAKAVIDDEAVDILLDYLDMYYIGDMEDEEFFGQSFAKTATRIMAGPSMTFNGVVVIIVVSIIGLSVLGVITINILKSKARKAEADAELLNADVSPINTSPEIENLENKYNK